MTSPNVVELPEWGRLALPGRWLRDDEARQQAARLTEDGRLEVRELRTGLELQARAYVGEVRLGELVVRVVPKLSPDALRRLLSFSHGSGVVSGSSGQGGAAELLAARLLAEAGRVLRQGPDARYHERSASPGSPRGRLDVAALARGGGLLAGARLPCRWSERGPDTPLNQALLGAVRLAARLAPGRRGAAAPVLAALEGAVTERPLDEALLAEARRTMGPRGRAYEPVLELATALARGQLPAGPGGLPGGFLFDLSRFFQAVVGRLLRGHLRGVEVHEEWPLHDLLRYAPDANPHQRRPPTPRPDFALFERGQLTALLDAKYRDLWAESLPREMLYQLTLYALGHGREAIIVYPSDDPYAREARVELRAPGVDGGPRAITLRPLPLTRLAQLLEIPSIAARQQLDALAAGLVRGVSLSASMSTTFDGVLRPDEAAGDGPTLIAWLEHLTAPVTDARDLAALTTALTAQARLIIEAEYIAFYLLDPGTERLILFAQHGFSPDEAAEAERTAHERHPGRVVRERQPLHIPDVEADADQRSSAQGRRHVIRSRLFLPIDGEGQCVGTLGVASARPHHFSPLIRAALAFLCRVTGVVYRNLWRMEALGKQLAQLEHQQRQLIELSAPIVEVRPGVLVLPVIGHLDEERAADLTGRLLQMAVARRARVVVLDLTGLALDDLAALDRLGGMLRALTLIGARGLLSGISPEVAIAATRAGVELPVEAASGTLLQALARVR